MGNIRVEGKKLIYQRKDELTIIEPYGMNCLRCRSTKNSKILDENWTVLPPATADDCHIECDGRFATITNGAMKATIDAGQIWYGGIITYFKKILLFFIQDLKVTTATETSILRATTTRSA